ncbi:MAG: glycerophosphodiester phosphodiesterase family protein, partial [Nocardioidaceae bacterium]
YRYLETDVHATRDDVLVASNDPMLERVVGFAALINNFTYDELRSTRIAGREPLPTLDELLTTWPEVRFNIDAKSSTAVAPLAATITRQRAWNRVCVASFSPRHLSQLRRLLGRRVATAYSALGAAALRLLPVRTLRTVALGSFAQAAQVPVRRGRLEIVTPAFIDNAHHLGKQVHVWTIDEPAEIERLLDLGVDAIMTDRIDVLRDVYQARGIWRDASP